MYPDLQGILYESNVYDIILNTPSTLSPAYMIDGAGVNSGSSSSSYGSVSSVIMLSMSL